MSVIDELGILGIPTRLLRLSEQIRKDGAALYKLFNIEIEPKWFPVIYTLSKKKVLGIVELASEIGYSHPSTISLLKELEKNKLIRSKKDKKDERKRLVQLTAKGEALIESMQPVWQIMINGLNEMTATKNNLLAAIIEVEEKMKQETFLQRAFKAVNLIQPTSDQNKK